MCDELNDDLLAEQSTKDGLIDFYQQPIHKQFERIDHILNEVWPEYRGGESER